MSGKSTHRQTNQSQMYQLAVTTLRAILATEGQEQALQACMDALDHVPDEMWHTSARQAPEEVTRPVGKRGRNRASHVTLVQTPDEVYEVRTGMVVVRVESLMLSVEQAASAMGWSQDRMYTALKSTKPNEFVYSVPIGGRRFVPMVALKDYLRRQLRARGQDKLAEEV